MAKDPYLEKTPAQTLRFRSGEAPPPGSASLRLKHGEGQDQDLLEEAWPLLVDSQASWAKGDLKGRWNSWIGLFAWSGSDGDPAVTQQRSTCGSSWPGASGHLHLHETEATGKRSSSHS